ncbi:ABC transporter permease [Fulvivirgaceae bacterium PWU4]|uniref:ABC transporter permease n=1 Tax=Chryseosolibacter histidini TaxID=2782349 RepID=A0AAP2GIH1_9BACT|nr:ABC transporter permease [Chryseosolibacter histidini]MBT1697044.1 ABC transporter permease [Chryseosolibacter histidini]
MLNNYFKIAIRVIRRSASYALINVSGLGLGIACAILIFSLISYHLGFDNFHHHSDRVYRFVTEEHRDAVNYASAVPPAFGKTFRDDYPFGEKVARICVAEEAIISFESNGEQKKFKVDARFAEPEFFDIFNFPLVSGANHLHQANKALITEAAARKYFGNDPAVGKTFRFQNEIDFEITGVLRDFPIRTDVGGSIFLSYTSVGQYNEWYGRDDAWGGITESIQTYARLRDGVHPADVEAVLPAYVKKYRDQSKNVHHYKLQPLADLHFDPRYGGRIPESGVWILAVVGFFLVFTACLNFINLATAQAMGRTREVGVRKVMGSTRPQLFWQFTTETFSIVMLAFLVAFGIATGVLPYINELFSTQVTLQLSDPSLWIFSIVTMVVVTFLAGAYPGMVLSGFRPVSALKGKLQDLASRSLNLRRSLIIAQLIISQVLLIGLIVISNQMKYIRQADLGFDEEAVVMIPTASNDAKMKTLKEQFLRTPGVEKVSVCFGAPASRNNWSTSFKFDNRTESEVFSGQFKGADADYLSTFGIDLVAGRNLVPSDSVREFLVNETMASRLGIAPEEMLGRHLSFNGDEFKGHIVGVVRDFHDQPLRSQINPLFITTSMRHYNSYAVKINMSQAATVLPALEKLWSATYPERIYEYAFLDNETAQFYETEQLMLTMIRVFSGIALFIGCMGLYGLVSFMSVRRTKEIGIRKVLGGSVAHILWLFGKEFYHLILVAFALAAPAGWFLMSKWLELYEYHAGITVWTFAAELVVIALIVLTTVGYVTTKAALANPARALKDE